MGSLPDSAKFTSDCTKLIVAIEGEVRNVEGRVVDPEGGVMVIDFGSLGPQTGTQPTKNFVDFTSFNNRYVPGHLWVNINLFRVHWAQHLNRTSTRRSDNVWTSSWHSSYICTYFERSPDIQCRCCAQWVVIHKARTPTLTVMSQ